MSDTRRNEFSRRQWLGGVVGGVGLLILNRGARAQASAVTLPPLPYPENALEPYISARTVGFHYGKHHRAYVDTTNKLIAGTDLAHKDLVEIIRAAAGKPDRVPLFNNAAQAWNHDFYWKSMKPKGGGTPSGALAKRIATDFGSFDALAKELTTAATTQFGSGWAWLVEGPGGKLQVMKTGNADNPLTVGKKPLLTMDVWEHAYYLDYQNKRADYVKAFLDHLVAWDFVESNLARGS